MEQKRKPVVLITGAEGNLGQSVMKDLAEKYAVVGLDRESSFQAGEIYELDITSPASLSEALEKVRAAHGDRIDAVIHLVGYFDFTGEPNRLYDAINLEGTGHLLAALEPFDVGRFIYASTMLVHAPCQPGERIDEQTPLGPRWEYPRSKCATERLIRERAAMPYAILRLAGVYDAQAAPPTLAHQIARIYEENLEAHLYSGDMAAGQSMLHREDLLAALARTVERRDTLPPDAEILIGEPYAVPYRVLQERLGELIHGREGWRTTRVPKALAKLGAAAQEKLEPAVPDEIDKGEAPFIRPFMVAMADDHYAIDIARAKDWLGWSPEHALETELEAMVCELKTDPSRWYAANGITMPSWLDTLSDENGSPEDRRRSWEQKAEALHRQWRWTHLGTMGLGLWLATQPLQMDNIAAFQAWLEVVLGLSIVLGSFLAMSRTMAFVRWLTGGCGMIVMALPMVFITPSAASYLSDSLIGALVFALAIGAPPEVGPSIAARSQRPEIPPGWTFNPSAWLQRLPVIALAFSGLLFSRYLAVYQMGHIETVWEPFFAGATHDPRNGTEEIITSSVSRAWPVPDAALGAFTYLLEILTGIVGSRARWRTMPWLVILFGLLIVPLGLVSIGFIIIQPIVIGTWSTLTLAGAAAMLLQIPYSLDELAASMSYVWRRHKRGESLLAVVIFGGPDEGDALTRPEREFDRPFGTVLREMWTGAVNLPPSLWLVGVIGVSFLFTRLTLGATGAMADADHLLGALILAVLAVAAAEVARAARFALVPLGLAMIVCPWFLNSSRLHLAVNLLFGISLIFLSRPQGRITERYGALQWMIR